MSIVIDENDIASVYDNLKNANTKILYINKQISDISDKTNGQLRLNKQKFSIDDCLEEIKKSKELKDSYSDIMKGLKNTDINPLETQTLALGTLDLKNNTYKFDGDFSFGQIEPYKFDTNDDKISQAKSSIDRKALDVEDFKNIINGRDDLSQEQKDYVINQYIKGNERACTVALSIFGLQFQMKENDTAISELENEITNLNNDDKISILLETRSGVEESLAKTKGELTIILSDISDLEEWESPSDYGYDYQLEQCNKKIEQYENHLNELNKQLTVYDEKTKQLNELRQANEGLSQQIYEYEELKAKYEFDYLDNIGFGKDCDLDKAMEGSVLFEYDDFSNWTADKIAYYLSSNQIFDREPDYLLIFTYMYNNVEYKEWYNNKYGKELTKEEFINQVGLSTIINDEHSLEARAFLMMSDEDINKYVNLKNKEGNGRERKFLNALEPDINKSLGWQMTLERADQIDDWDSEIIQICKTFNIGLGDGMVGCLNNIATALNRKTVKTPTEWSALYLCQIFQYASKYCEVTKEDLLDMKNDNQISEGTYNKLLGKDKITYLDIDLANGNITEDMYNQFLDARKNDKQLDKFIDKLKDSGEKFNFTYQVGSNIGNMLPSQIAGFVTGGAGWASSLVLFTSAYGGNYKENKRQGYSELASNVVGLLSAAGELGTEFVLGKIAGIGMTKDIVEEAVDINTLADFMKYIGSKGMDVLQEIGEEELQNVYDAFLNAATYNLSNGKYGQPFKLDGNEALQTLYITAVTTILMNAPTDTMNLAGQVANNINLNKKVAFQLENGKIVEITGRELLNFSDETGTVDLKRLNTFLKSESNTNYNLSDSSGNIKLKNGNNRVLLNDGQLADIKITKDGKYYLNGMKITPEEFATLTELNHLEYVPENMNLEPLSNLDFKSSVPSESSQSTTTDTNQVMAENIVETIKNALASHDAKYGLGNGLKSLQRVIETGNWNAISRNGDARNILQSLGIETIKKYYDSFVSTMMSKNNVYTAQPILVSNAIVQNGQSFGESIIQEGQVESKTNEKHVVEELKEAQLENALGGVQQEVGQENLEKAETISTHEETTKSKIEDASSEFEIQEEKISTPEIKKLTKEEIEKVSKDLAERLRKDIPNWEEALTPKELSKIEENDQLRKSWGDRATALLKKGMSSTLIDYTTDYEKAMSEMSRYASNYHANVEEAAARIKERLQATTKEMKTPVEIAKANVLENTSQVEITDELSENELEKVLGGAPKEVVAEEIEQLSDNEGRPNTSIEEAATTMEEAVQKVEAAKPKQNNEIVDETPSKVENSAQNKELSQEEIRKAINEAFGEEVFKLPSESLSREQEIQRLNDDIGKHQDAFEYARNELSKYFNSILDKLDDLNNISNSSNIDSTTSRLMSITDNAKMTFEKLYNDIMTKYYNTFNLEENINENEKMWASEYEQKVKTGIENLTKSLDEFKIKIENILSIYKDNYYSNESYKRGSALLFYRSGVDNLIFNLEQQLKIINSDIKNAANSLSSKIYDEVMSKIKSKYNDGEDVNDKEKQLTTNISDIELEKEKVQNLEDQAKDAKTKEIIKFNRDNEFWNNVKNATSVEKLVDNFLSLDVSERESMFKDPVAITLFSMTFDQLQSLLNYSGETYQYINTPLRRGDALNYWSQKLIRDVNNIILKSGGLRETQVVYRGLSLDKIDSSTLLGSIIKRSYNSGITGLYKTLKQLIGQSGFERAFSSTTSNEHSRYVRDSEIVLEITAPKGTAAMDISPFSANPLEDEILFATNTKYYYTDVELRSTPDGGQQIVIKATVENQITNDDLNNLFVNNKKTIGELMADVIGDDLDRMFSSIEKNDYSEYYRDALRGRAPRDSNGGPYDIVDFVNSKDIDFDGYNYRVKKFKQLENVYHQLKNIKEKVTQREDTTVSVIEEAVQEVQETLEQNNEIVDETPSKVETTDELSEGQLENVLGGVQQEIGQESFENIETSKEESVSTSIEEALSTIKEAVEEVKEATDTSINTTDAMNEVVGKSEDTSNLGENIDNRIETGRNRVFETANGIAFGKNDPLALHTNSEHIYRNTGLPQIEDILECGYVRPKKGKMRGGKYNEIDWSRGSDRLFYVDKSNYVLETFSSTVQNDQIGAISINDLTAIWHFDKNTNQYVNILNDIKNEYNKKHNIVKDENISSNNTESLNTKVEKATSEIKQENKIEENETTVEPTKVEESTSNEIKEAVEEVKEVQKGIEETKKDNKESTAIEVDELEESQLENVGKNSLESQVDTENNTDVATSSDQIKDAIQEIDDTQTSLKDTTNTEQVEDVEQSNDKTILERIRKETNSKEKYLLALQLTTDEALVEASKQFSEFSNERAQIIAKISDDRLKIQMIDDVQNNFAKGIIVKSLSNDQLKMSNISKFGNWTVHLLEMATSLDSDTNKLKVMEYVLQKNQDRNYGKQNNVIDFYNVLKTFHSGRDLVVGLQYLPVNSDLRTNLYNKLSLDERLIADKLSQHEYEQIFQKYGYDIAKNVAIVSEAIRITDAKYGDGYGRVLELIKYNNYDMITRQDGARDLISLLTIYEIKNALDIIQNINKTTWQKNSIDSNINKLVYESFYKIYKKMGMETAINELENFALTNDANSVYYKLLGNKVSSEVMQSYLTTLKTNFDNNPYLCYLSSLSKRQFLDIAKNNIEGKGADQGIFKVLLKNQKYQQEYTRILNEFSSQYSISTVEAAKIMALVDSIGACTYGATLTALIVEKFRNNPVTFKEKFGFSLYITDSNGNYVLNTAQLLLDFYYFANHVENGGRLFNNGTIISPDGTAESQIYVESRYGINVNVFNKYFNSKGMIDVITQIDNVIFDNNDSSSPNSTKIKKIIDEYRPKNCLLTIGYTHGEFDNKVYDNMNLIKVDDYSLEKSLGGKLKDIYKRIERSFSSTKTNDSSGGHAIYIVGYDERGLIVNTWGDNYLIEWNNLDLENVDYNINIWDIKRGRI